MEFHSIKKIYIYIYPWDLIMNPRWRWSTTTLHWDPSTQPTSPWQVGYVPAVASGCRGSLRLCSKWLATNLRRGKAMALYVGSKRNETKFPRPKFSGEVVGDGSREDVKLTFWQNSWDNDLCMIYHILNIYLYIIYVWFCGEFGWKSGETRTVSQWWGDCGESASVSQYVQDTLYANTTNWMLYQPIINTLWYPYQLMPRNCCWRTLVS